MTPLDSRDFSQKFLFQHRPIRGEFVRLTETYQTVLGQHAYPPAIQTLLGEALACTALIHGLFKNTGKITLQFQGTGELTLLSIHGDRTYMRGVAQYAPTLAEAPSLLIALQSGKLVLTYDFGNHAQHQSVLEVVSERIAQNLEHYFAQSEQIETRILLASSPQSVSGLLLQRLPTTESEKADADEAWNDALIRSNTLFDEELRTLPLDTLLTRLFSEDSIEVFEPERLHFECPCSKARMEKALVTMGKADVLRLLETEEQVEVTCQFCGKAHAFDAIDVAQIFRGEAE